MAVVEFYSNRLTLAETIRNVFQATVEPTISREDLRDPKFWCHVAKQFQPYTRIEVVTDDGQYFCELIVLSSGNNWAKVQELRYIELGSKVADVDESRSEYEVAWKGPVRKHAIIRKADGEIIKEGFVQKDEADMAMRAYIKAIT